MEFRYSTTSNAGCLSPMPALVSLDERTKINILSKLSKRCLRMSLDSPLHLDNIILDMRSLPKLEHLSKPNKLPMDTFTTLHPSDQLWLSKSGRYFVSYTLFIEFGILAFQVSTPPPRSRIVFAQGYSNTPRKHPGRSFWIFMDPT